MRHVATGCKRCGAVTLFDPAGICQECRSIGPAFDDLFAFGIYAGVLKEVIHKMKFGKIKRLARMLGRELGRLDLPEADSIVPVPLSRNGLKRREFNQSAVIAGELSRCKRIPLNIFALIKRRETKPQSSMSREKRIENVRGAFMSGDELKGKRVILVDDVVTTGATVNECAKVLKKAGVKSVIVVTAARATNE